MRSWAARFRLARRRAGPGRCRVVGSIAASSRRIEAEWHPYPPCRLRRRGGSVTATVPRHDKSVTGFGCLARARGAAARRGRCRECGQGLRTGKGRAFARPFPRSRTRRTQAGASTTGAAPGAPVPSARPHRRAMPSREVGPSCPAAPNGSAGRRAPILIRPDAMRALPISGSRGRVIAFNIDTINPQRPDFAQSVIVSRSASAARGRGSSGRTWGAGLADEAGGHPAAFSARRAGRTLRPPGGGCARGGSAGATRRAALEDFRAGLPAVPAPAGVSPRAAGGGA